MSKEHSGDQPMREGDVTEQSGKPVVVDNKNNEGSGSNAQNVAADKKQAHGYVIDAFSMNYSGS
jgi:hypothetical protein